MELPSSKDLLLEEKWAKVDLREEERMIHPIWFNWPYAKILQYVSSFPAPPPRTNWTSGAGEYVWDARYKGYIDWAVPDTYHADADTHMTLLMHRMMMANNRQNAEIQMKKLFAAPIERALRWRSQTTEHSVLQEKIFVMKYSLSPFASSYSDDYYERLEDENVRVWRLITCFGETTLNTLHDRILGPAMGWVRHYHSYKYIIPTNGACFGPERSEAIDSMHGMRSYTLDDSRYQLAHVLREPGQRLAYIYDLGDTWVHNIELLQIAQKGDFLNLPTDDQVKADLVKRYGSELPRLTGVQLFAGEMNCPPEDSSGCDGMGCYGNLLKKGPNYKSSSAAMSTNWRPHQITNAYKFNLAEHADRLADAISGKSSAKSGHKKCVFPIHDCCGIPSILDRSAGIGEKVKQHVNTGWAPITETVKTRPDDKSEAVCAHCGRQPNVELGAKPLLRCGGCKSARYCGTSCQKWDWDSHKAKCRAMKKERQTFKYEESENLSRLPVKTDM